jgi:hypothetical protein
VNFYIFCRVFIWNVSMAFKSYAAGAVVVLSILGPISTATADVVLTSNLTQDNCSGGCSNGVTPFGTVTISQTTTGADLVQNVQLGSPYFFSDSTGLEAFVFNPVGTLGIVTSTLPTGFTAGGSVMEDGFKQFTTSISYTAPKTVQSLTFDIDVSNTFLLDSSDFGLSTGNGGTKAFFAADITGNGNTEPVGALPLTTAVSEPSTWAMVILGFVGVGFMAYRRKQSGPSFRLA